MGMWLVCVCVLVIRVVSCGGDGYSGFVWGWRLEWFFCLDFLFYFELLFDFGVCLFGVLDCLVLGWYLMGDVLVFVGILVVL